MAILDRAFNGILRLINVRREELLPILLAAFYFFCILTSLAMLRPARDALGMEAGIDQLRWLFVGTLLVTLLVNPLFGSLVSKFRRLTFISATHGFFVVSLMVFASLLLLTPQGLGERVGQVYYVWHSVFNLFMTMVFWALMADRFSLAQGKRMFGVIAVGGTLGAIYGPMMAWALAEVIGTPMLLVLASAFIVLATAAAWGVALVQPELERSPDDPEAPPAVDESSIIGGKSWDGLREVFHSPYLLALASYILILAVVVTFIYFTRLQMVAVLGDDTDARTGLLAQIDVITQVATLVLQLIVAGRVMRWFGVHVALVLLPVTTMLGFLGLALVGSLAALITFEACFRAVQRAIMRPARETLWTVVGREEKYKAKAFIDTFVYRGGDALGAGTEGALGRLGMGLYALAAVAVPLALVWAAIGLWLGREQSRQARERDGAAEEAVAGDIPEPEAAR